MSFHTEENGPERAESSRLSRLLSYVLRHNPDHLGVRLDAEGWTDAEILRQRLGISAERLRRLVESDGKGRYALRAGRIRAHQGHTVEVNPVASEPVAPPEYLFHGTTRERWEKIRESGGLHRGRRHHVHLSENLELAWRAARRWRREEPCVLRILAERRHRDGGLFWISANRVWLCHRVEVAYLEIFPLS